LLAVDASLVLWAAAIAAWWTVGEFLSVRTRYADLRESDPQLPELRMR
jgi:hypothetical protein